MPKEIAQAALFAEIEALLAGRQRLLVAIDGRCGSGKTTLAKALQVRFGGNLFHMDDFYLPVSRRVADWQNRPAANMDLERFEAEVLRPAKAGQLLEYCAFSCPERCYRPPVQVAPAALTLIEGSYALHPRLQPYYDRAVFVTCSKIEQQARLRAREGDHYAAFETTWIPLEEGYFAQYAVEEKADWRLDTTE